MVYATHHILDACEEESTTTEKSILLFENIHRERRTPGRGLCKKHLAAYITGPPAIQVRRPSTYSVSLEGRPPGGLATPQ